MKNERERQLEGKLQKAKEELKLAREEVHVHQKFFNTRLHLLSF